MTNRSQARTSISFLLGAALLLISTALLPAAASSQQPNPNASLNKEFDESIYDLLEKNCLACHAGTNPKAGMDLGNFDTAEEVAKSPTKFQKVILNIRSQVMPPIEGQTPSLEDREKIVSWINRALSRNGTLNSPGHVTIRRLNKNEYNRTLEDLLYITGDFSRDFPSDDIGYGFDNIGDVLTMTPLHLEMYLKGARAATEQAVSITRPRNRLVDITKAKLSTGVRIADDSLFYYTNGTASLAMTGLQPGEYELHIELAATAIATGPAKANVLVNGLLLQSVEVKTASPTRFKFPVLIRQRESDISIAFTNDFYAPNAVNPNERDRNLILHSLELVGPNATVPNTTGSGARLIFSQPTQSKSHLVAAREVLEEFASRAYRRPISSQESNRLMEIYQLVRKNGDSYEEGVIIGMQAVLVNPNFLFRVELDTNSSGRELNGYELASRLSYFLWNSIPDDTLTALAANKKLTDPKIIADQVDRMLSDPKARRFSNDFSTQWLEIERLAEFTADPTLFQNFDDSLKADLTNEVTTYFHDMLVNQRPIREFIDGKYTFVNNRLARHYRMPGDFGEELQRVDVSNRYRGGLLGMGAILSVTSNPNRTSPIKRGKFVMEQLLGTPPPPPPPNVGVLDDTKEAITATRIRERLEQHRKDPQCASCHRPLDAYGFALENFSAVGQYRTTDGNFPVDNTGELPGKQTITGIEGLKQNILARENDFTRTLIEKTMTYALGRGLTPTDQVKIEAMTRKIRRPVTLKKIITEIVLSDEFRKRPGQK